MSTPAGAYGELGHASNSGAAKLTLPRLFRGFWLPRLQHQRDWFRFTLQKMARSRSRACPYLVDSRRDFLPTVGRLTYPISIRSKDCDTGPLFVLTAAGPAPSISLQFKLLFSNLALCQSYLTTLLLLLKPDYRRRLSLVSAQIPSQFVDRYLHLRRVWSMNSCFASPFRRE